MILDLFAPFGLFVSPQPQWYQVHRAKLRTGREVAVKVQRPNVERRLMSDISAPGIGDDSDDGRGIYRVTRIRREGHGYGKSEMSSDVFWS